MKLAVIGGAGVRTPLLVRGLCGSGLLLSEIALFDTDPQRLALIGPLAQRFAGEVRIRLCASAAESIEGASFVITSIRVGGIQARARYEQVALDHGIVGQETVGPGGFAMALATIPDMLRYAREVEARAPDAWIVSFTNPVGIITQAVKTATQARILGICDTPLELFEQTAHALGLPSAECHFDYFGLNHLGWLREVYHRGAPQLQRLWGNAEGLRSIYRGALFEAEFLSRLRLLPTEYLFYYYQSRRAFESFARAGRGRGDVIRELNGRLFARLAEPGVDAASVYDAYLAERNAGYMQVESGSATAVPPPATAAVTGYDKIAVSVVRAIHGNTNELIPLSVPNRGNLPELRGDDVVEVPCLVNANGALPLHVGPVPAAVRELLLQVKEYERLTVEAALSGSKEAARRALARNPLVADEQLAARLVAALA